jgi:hypothetical protein
VEIEAKDVMAYVYRRIMRQGFNDSYQLVDGVQLGLKTVTQRALLITLNALAPDNPNIIEYLTPMYNENDTIQSRVVPDFSTTAWEQIDDMAATAGLDYTTVGRRIIYWDTHYPIGTLPELGDGDFNASPIVTEYGMSLANSFAVTNNSGVYGLAYAYEGDVAVPFKSYGLVEQLASAYGESEGGTTETLTPASKAALVKTLAAQARRNLDGRWPTPLVVRIPDNSTLNPDVNLSINHLIPGVWIPLRANETVRKVSQMQKLDSVQVLFDSKGEQVQVTMSPTPDGNDPDSDASEVVT